MLFSIVILISSVFLSSANSEARQCRNSWQNYKDELCVKSELKVEVNPEIRSIQNLLENAKAQMDNLNKMLYIISSRVVPIGSILVEYNNQPNPPELWPDFKWQDISSEYDGLFFRALGGGAADWGTVQDECAPRATHSYHPLYIRSSSSDSDLFQGFSFSNSPRSINDPLRSLTYNCEIRPRNQAIRVWKCMG